MQIGNQRAASEAPPSVTSTVKPSNWALRSLPLLFLGLGPLCLRCFSSLLFLFTPPHTALDDSLSPTLPFSLPLPRQRHPTSASSAWLPQVGPQSSRPPFFKIFFPSYPKYRKAPARCPTHSECSKQHLAHRCSGRPGCVILTSYPNLSESLWPPHPTPSGLFSAPFSLPWDRLRHPCLLKTLSLASRPPSYPASHTEVTVNQPT